MIIIKEKRLAEMKVISNVDLDTILQHPIKSVKSLYIGDSLASGSRIAFSKVSNFQVVSSRSSLTGTWLHGFKGDNFSISLNYAEIDRIESYCNPNDYPAHGQNVLNIILKNKVYIHLDFVF